MLLKIYKDLYSPDVGSILFEGLKQLLHDILDVFDFWAAQSCIFWLKCKNHHWVTLLEHLVNVLNIAMLVVCYFALVISHVLGIFIVSRVGNKKNRM